MSLDFFGASLCKIHFERNMDKMYKWGSWRKSVSLNLKFDLIFVEHSPESMALAHDEVSDGPSLRLRESLTSVICVQTRNRRRRPRIKYVNLKNFYKKLLSGSLQWIQYEIVNPKNCFLIHANNLVNPGLHFKLG